MKYYKDFAKYRYRFNILVLTANDIEFASVKLILKKIQIGTEFDVFEVLDNNNGQVYVLGKIGIYDVILTKLITQGSDTRNGVVNTITNANSLWVIDYVLMAGVCGALNTKNTPINSVVISKQIIAYENIKLKSGTIIDRAPKYDSGQIYNKLDQYILENQEVNGVKVKKGIVLSGAKLVSDLNKVEELTSLYPDADVVEMEGEGLASLCNNLKIEWLMIKGVSDDCVKKDNSSNQEVTMKNVVSVIEMIFNREALFRIKPEIHRKNNSVLISGSYPTNREDTEEVGNFTYRLVTKMLEEGLYVVTGKGTTIGDYVIAAVYDYCIVNRIDLFDRIIIYPFVKDISPKQEVLVTKYKKHNRESMTKASSFALFIYGRKTRNDVDISAKGVYDEYTESFEKGLNIIPAGFTGYQSLNIWEEVHDKFLQHYPNSDKQLKDQFLRLNDNSLSEEQKIDTIIEFIKSLKKIYQ
jgi:adenosylhomocysteine nucleosidase